MRSAGFAEAVAVDESKQLYQFAWLVQMEQTDSPYASESDWKFDVFVTTEQGEGLEVCGGCGGVKVDYEMTVVAYDDVLEGAKELRFQRFGR